MTTFAPFLFFFHLLDDIAATYSIQYLLVGGRNEKRRVLKDPADYRPASNSYPVKTLQRDERCAWSFRVNYGASTFVSLYSNSATNI
jgi:hypothetical protein